MSFADYDSFDGLGLAGLVKAGEVSPLELLDEAIERAERVNPRLNAIVYPMYDIARRRAAEVPRDRVFSGLPFLLKDLSAGAYAGVPHTGGSRLYRSYVPEVHSELVRRYLEAGVVVFGKTNTPEMGILPVTEPELHGPCHNPWRHGVTPGGSSGGAAAAVAAGILPVAHASDGGGSIRIPASCCGLFGLKPSRARQPVGPDKSEGLFGFSVEHVVSRSVRDSAAMLDATAGVEPHSMFHAAPADGFLASLEQGPEKKLRIAYTSDPLLPGVYDADTKRAVADAVGLLSELGHELVEARPPIDAQEFASAFFYQFAVGVASELIWAERLHHRPTGPADVERSTWLLSMAGRAITGAEFAVKRRILMEQARGVMRFMDDYDLFLCPTLGKPPIPHGTMDPEGWEAMMHQALVSVGTSAMFRIPGLLDRAAGRAYHFAPYTMVFNVTGQPSASVPLFWNDGGLPIGVMLTAGMGEESRILRLAAQLEEARPWFERRAPTHAAT